MRSFTQGLTARLAGSFLLLALGLVVLIGGLTYSLVQRALTVSAFDELETVWQLRNNALHRWIRDQAQPAQALAASPSLQTLAGKIIRAPLASAEHTTLRNQLLAELTPLLRFVPQVSRVLILDPAQDRVCFSTEPVLEGQQFTHAPALSQTSAAPYLQKDPASSAEEQSTYSLTVPFGTESGQAKPLPLGRLVIQFKHERLAEIITDDTTQRQHPIDGYLLDKARTLVTIPPLAQSTTLTEELVPGSKLAGSGQHDRAHYTNHRQISVLGVYGWVPELEMTLVVELPQQVVLAPARRLTGLIGGAGALLTLLLTGLLTRQLRRWVARPLQALELTALSAAQGDLAPRAPHPTHDEIGALAASFAKLFARLSGLQEKLVEQERLNAERHSSADQFTQAFFASPIPMCIGRITDFSVVAANDEYLRLTGLAREQLNGKSDQELGFIVEPAARQQFFEQLLSRDSLRNYELDVTCRQRDLTLLVSSEKVLFNGEPCLLGSFQDITERKEAEARFAKVFHANPISMTLIRVRDQRIIEVNASTLRLTGLTRSELLGKTIAELRPEATPQARQAWLERLETSGSLYDFELAVNYPTGKHILLACAEIMTFNGEPCILLSQQDITARKQAEELFSKAFHFTPLPMSLISVPGQQYVRVNAAWEELTGYQLIHAAGRTVEELNHWANETQRKEFFRQLAERQRVRDFEAELLAFDGEIKTFLISAEVIQLNGQAHVLSLGNDITARKQAEAARCESERRLSLALEAATMGVYTLEIPTQQVYWSPECYRIFGIEQFGGTISEIQRQLFPADRERVMQTAFHALQTQTPLEMEFRILHPDGTVHWVNDRGRATYDAAGKPLRQIGIVQDITERKLAEQALRRWADAFEHCAHGIAIGDPETNYISFCNPAFARLRGGTVDQITGSPIVEMYEPAERAHVPGWLATADQHGSVQVETRLLKTDGSDFPAQLDIVSVKDETGKLLYRVATIQDITQRKQAQAALRESEMRHRIALEAAQLGTWRRDFATGICHLDEAACAQIGWKTAELAWAEMLALVHPDDYEQFYAKVSRPGPDSKDGRYSDEFRIVLPKAQIRWLAINGRVQFEGTGDARRPLYAVGTILDITERKLAEERFSKAFHTNPTPMSIARVSDRVILEINQAFLELAGWQRAEVLGRTIAEIGFVIQDSLRDEAYANLAAGKPLRNREMRVRLKGKERILLSSAEPLSLNGEHCILWSSLDITELKRAEERFAKAFHANPIPMALLRTSDRRVFEVNRSFEQISGAPRAAIIGTNVDEAGVQLDSQQRAAFNHQLLTTGSARDFEFTVAYPSNVRTVLASAELIVLGGEPCILLSQQDITERKQAEERFTKAFNANPNPMALLALPSSEYVHVNEAWVELTGYTPDEIIGKQDRELNNWVDQTRRVEFYQRLTEQGRVRDFEALIHTRDQRPLIFQISGEIVQINAQPHLLICCNDITERKHAEQALQASEERFRTLAATSQAAIVIHDDEHFLYANPAAEELYGYTNAELTQLSLWAMIHPESRTTADELRAALRHASPWPRRDELKIVTRQGLSRWIDAALGFIQLEGRRCCIVTSFDITSRKETKEALKISEERFAAAFNASPEAMSLATYKDGCLVLINDACLRLWGLSREAALGRPISDFNLWADPQQGETAYQMVRETGAVHNFEAQMYLADGELGYILISAEVVRLGNEQFVLSVSKNITERKRAEAAIQASETRFRTLTESSPTAILIFDELQFYYVNPAAEEMFGYTKAEFTQLSMRQLLDANSWVSVRQRQEARRRGEPLSQRHEVMILTKSGQKRWIDYSSSLIELEGQQRYIVTASDITKRKRAEAAIQASEIRFRTLAESSQAAILIFDEKHYFYANPASCELLGYTERELRRLKLANLLHPDSYELIQQQLSARERGEPIPQRNEALIVTKTGQQRWVDYSLGVAEMDGKPRYIVTALDVTQRRQMEAALHASEARFRTLTESSQAAIVIYAGAQFIYANPAAERLLGYSLSELLQLGIWEIIHPDSHAFVNDIQLALLQDSQPSLRSEIKIIRKDGQTRWIDNAGALIEIDGKALRIVTSFDITERKQAEEALRVSEERFALTFDACPDGMALTAFRDGLYVMANQAWLSIFGYAKEQVIGQPFLDLPIWGSREQREYVYQTVRERGAFRNFEVKFEPAQGEVTYLLLSSEVVRLGEEKFVLSVSKDITERKRVEAALLASEAKFRTLAETSQAATFIYADDCFIYANPAAESLLGYSQSDISQLTIWDVLHPDAQTIFADRRAALLRGEPIPMQAEIQVLTKTGALRWINAAVAFIQIGGKPCRLVTAFDVTERRQAEEDLRVSQEQLRNLAARLQEVREEERAAISREIHDELGQALTGMKMDLKWLEKQLPADTPTGQQRLASLYELINTTIQNVRQLASSLRPGVLDDFGLVAALEWLAQDFAKRTGITIRFLEMPEDFPLERERATAVFRIFQEALTNIARHAEASLIEVRLTNSDTQLCLAVRDNGKGITADQINHIRSLGLVGMRERALLLGGTFNINGTPGLGTTVTVQIPSIVPSGGPYDSHPNR
jgi:PAS domain S-box-containing protein